MNPPGIFEEVDVCRLLDIIVLILPAERFTWAAGGAEHFKYCLSKFSELSFLPIVRMKKLSGREGN